MRSAVLAVGIWLGLLGPKHQAKFEAVGILFFFFFFFFHRKENLVTRNVKTWTNEKKLKRLKLLSTAVMIGTLRVSFSSLSGLSFCQHQFKLLVKVFKRLYLLNLLMVVLMVALMLDTGLKFYTVPSQPT